MLALEAVAMVNRIYKRMSYRRPEIRRFEEYFEGNQPLNYATKEWKEANAARYADFSDNWCGVVVNAEAERLHHTGIKLEGNPDGAKMLWEDWVSNELESQASQGLTSTLVAKRSFVSVWGDSDGNPTASWEHAANVELEYDFSTPGSVIAALKTWIDEKTEYATLYTPTELWKFQRPRQVALNENDPQSIQAQSSSLASGGWTMREVPGETWPLPNPLGVVPVVEIPNRPTLRGEPVSELQGVIPMQDAINLLWAYLFLAADYASLPARVMLRTAPPKIPILDKDGNVIGGKPVDMKDLAEKRLLSLEGADADIKQWDAARLDVFTEAIDEAVGHISSQTRTPPTYLVSKVGMSNVNSQGLKSSEIGLTMKAREFITAANPAFRRIYQLFALVRDDQALAKQVRTSTMEWASPEIRSDAEMADMLMKKRAIGYPFEYLLELDGLSPVDIARVLRMKQDEMNDPWIEQAQRPIDTSNAPVE